MSKTGHAGTLDRRERRRRQAVRAHLLDQLEELDGVRYVHPDAQEGTKDARTAPNAGPDDSECVFCSGMGYTATPDGNGCLVKEPCTCTAMGKFLALGVRP